MCMVCASIRTRWQYCQRWQIDSVFMCTSWAEWSAHLLGQSTLRQCCNSRPSVNTSVCCGLARIYLMSAQDVKKKTIDDLPFLRPLFVPWSNRPHPLVNQVSISSMSIGNPKSWATVFVPDTRPSYQWPPKPLPILGCWPTRHVKFNVNMIR